MLRVVINAPHGWGDEAEAIKSAIKSLTEHLPFAEKIKMLRTITEPRTAIFVQIFALDTGWMNEIAEAIRLDSLIKQYTIEFIPFAAVKPAGSSEIQRPKNI